MMVYVANPLYDAVFKYLMEDERIAKTILSALLQKEVLEVKMRRNEYSNINRNAISMFRIDFAAKVKEKDGSQKLILIELQKTWLETETLRFRQYLALQYNNKENMTKESDNKYALPTIAVYLLGHRVGEINEPVVYAQHTAIHLLSILSYPPRKQESGRRHSALSPSDYSPCLLAKESVR